jgi:hypothetical protein
MVGDKVFSWNNLLVGRGETDSAQNFRKPHAKPEMGATGMAHFDGFKRFRGD